MKKIITKKSLNGEQIEIWLDETGKLVRFVGDKKQIYVKSKWRSPGDGLFIASYWQDDKKR